MSAADEYHVYECGICGYKYHEADGVPAARISPGTGWDAVPDEWICPMCGAEKASFARTE